jgi:DNA polymerase III delta prime subunit
MTTYHDNKSARLTAKSEAEEELKCLIGMKETKELIAKFAAFAKTESARDALGHRGCSVPRHTVLTGPPGVGKTTVARIIAKLFYGYGVLRLPTFIETDRNGLVGTHVGHTGQKTLDVLEKARGGVLFIDEAYSLANDFTQDFGREAINTINKFIEDNRDDIMIIVAGYKDAMEHFFAMNAGLRGRIKWPIDLPDYGPQELCRIFNEFVLENEFHLTPAAKARAALLIHLVWANREPDFANGRVVRGIWETALLEQGSRINGKVTTANATVIKESDILTEGYCPTFDFKKAEAQLHWIAKCPRCSRPFSFSVDELGEVARCRCGEKLALPWWSLDSSFTQTEFSLEMARHGYVFSPAVAETYAPRPRRPKQTQTPNTKPAEAVQPPPTDSKPQPPAERRSVPRSAEKIWQPLRSPYQCPRLWPNLPPVEWWGNIAHSMVFLFIIVLFLLVLITPIEGDTAVVPRTCAVISLANVACVFLWILLRPGDPDSG